MNQFYEDKVYLSATPIRTRIKLTWRCYRYYRGDWDAMLKFSQQSAIGILKKALSNPNICKSLAESMQQNNVILEKLKKKGIWAAD